MDEEQEKPFDIVIIVMLLIIAIANDIAEVFFDLLDFTGVGIVGEAIMEPANFLLDLFFTGVFVWKCGWGGGTISQYIGDLLEPLLIPARTISVIAGIWVANNPNSMVGKVATTAASLEGGKVGGELGEAENVAGTAGKIGAEAEESEKALQSGAVSAEGANGRAGESKAANEGNSNTNATESESPEGKESGNEEEGKKNAAEREMEAKEEGNPMENLQEELEEPQQDESPSIPTEVEPPASNVVSINEGRRQPQSQEKSKKNITTPGPKIINIDEDSNKKLDKAA